MIVKIIKMVGGEELIGEFDEDTNVITNPVVMIPVSKEQIAFQPWMPYSEDKEYKLKEVQIHVIANPSSVIVNEYSRMYGSGIVVPSDGGGIIS
tara:strand:- start:1568 stop:1849 length:282 start_codon:yes stop_codon:yes gene_type:complete